MREVCYAGIDAVRFLQEGVYAREVEVALDDGLGVVFLEADVEICCDVGHDMCWCLFFEVFLAFVDREGFHQCALKDSNVSWDGKVKLYFRLYGMTMWDNSRFLYF